MALNSIYNAVKQHPVKLRTIQEVIQENPEKKNLFIDSEIVAGKNFLPVSSLKSNSTSVNFIAQELSSKNVSPVTVSLEDRQWQKCKCLKEKENNFFCQKFLMRCVKEKCPKKFIEI